MRGASRVIVLAVLLVGPVLVVPSVSAEWSREHAWGGGDARQLRAWAIDEDGGLHFATWHEQEYLLYEEGTGFNLTAWFVRSVQGLERVMVAQVGGEWGVLWQERVSDDRYRAGERSSVTFAFPDDAGELQERDLGGGFPPWHQAHQDPVTGDVHFLHVDGFTATRYSLAADGVGANVTVTDEAWRSESTSLFTRDYRVQLLPNGTVFGVEWNTDGARAVTWNGSGGPVVEPLTSYWDYRDGVLSVTENGTLAALLRLRRDACDLFVKHPGGNWSESRMTGCPFADADLGMSAFKLREDGSVHALTRKGFWASTFTRPERVPCIPEPGGWTITADGREFLLGPGPSLWERVPAPNVTAVVDPPDAPTGMAVSFRMEGNVSGLTDPAVKWYFPERVADGERVTHAFFKPGTLGWRMEVESGEAGCRGTSARVVGTFEASGVEREAPAPVVEGNETGNESDGEDGGSRIPAPGVTPALLAVAAAVGIVRWRGRARA